MRILTWNVNSVKIRLEHLLRVLHEIKPDIACLQEIKCLEEAFPRLEVESAGYNSAVIGQKSYNGVAILSRTPLAEVTRGFGDGDDDSQARLIAATIDGIRIASVYVPNGEAVGSDKYDFKLRWMERLRAWAATHFAGDRPALLCGDFNVAPAPMDVHDPSAWKDHVLFSEPERAALARVVDTGLVDLIRTMHPTEPMFSWWDYRMLAFPKGKGLRIDHLLATPSLAARAVASGVDRESRKGKQPSDHAAVWANFGEA